MGEIETKTPPSVEDLQKKIEELEAKVASQAETITLQEGRISELEETIDGKRVEIIDLSAKLKELHAGKTIEVKEQKSEPKKKAEIPADPIEYKGKKYRFRFAAFYYKANRYEAQDVALNPDLIAEILADKNQTLLREVF